jgi:MFS transporter, AAHS family, 4-hydroxybenzoate transporter
VALTNPIVDLQSFINERTLGRFQFLVATICSLTVFLDGFDVQSIAFDAPSISHEWHVPREQLGPIFVASLFGIMFGALLFGPVADKIGRRLTIIICTMIFGVFTLATARAESVPLLLICRFITGLGLGGAMPNAIALTVEYCPERRRATLVMIMFAGFSLGAGIAGALAAALIPDFGWRSVWYVGGALPLLLIPLQCALLPESIRFLVVKRAATDRIALLARSIDKRFEIPNGVQFEIGESAATGAPVVLLFRGGRTFGTICLWVMFFMNLLDLYLLQNWIPIMASATGVPVQTAVIIGALFQFGGFCAALSLGFAIDKFSAYRVLPILYGLGSIFVMALGQAQSWVVALMVLTFGAGFGVIGGQTSANALAAIFYPTAMRSSGVGWSLGIGRVGAIVGPIIGGFLILHHWSNSAIFLFSGLPPLCAAIAVYMMGRFYHNAGRNISELP